MDGIKIEVTGNIARIIERPARITAGTVGLPVEFSFDNQWEGLSKAAVFKAGCVEMFAENIETQAAIPWEVLQKPDVWLSVGVYGVSADGSVAIPTIWANVGVIRDGADLGVSPAPTPPVWQRIWNAIGNLTGLATNAKGNLVEAINEVNNIALAGGIESDPTLSQSGKAADAKATGDALAQKAPAGYGLGETLPIVDKAGLDSWTMSGRCLYYDDINPDSTLGSIAFVDCKGHNSSITSAVIQEAYIRKGNGVNILTRVYINGMWQPWEWDNPPMELGVEYRTTDRWNVNGVPKPLYVKALNIDSVENRLTIEPSGWGQMRVIEIVGEATLSDGNTIMIPGRYADTEAYFEQSYGYSSMPRLIVTDGFPIIGRPLNVRLKYWKTTD